MFVLSKIRRLVLSALLLALLGTGAELLLVGHTEDRLQWTPLLLILLCLIALTWNAVSRSVASIWLLQGTMALFLLGGVTGLVVHWQGKIEFKRETDSSLSGAKLFFEAMKSQSPPALAPGVFILMALLGLAYTTIRSTK